MVNYSKQKCPYKAWKAVRI